MRGGFLLLFFLLLFLFFPLPSDQIGGGFLVCYFFLSFSSSICFFGCSDGMEREACICDHGFERSDLCAEIIIIILIIRWPNLVRHQKSALFGSEIRRERSHSILFCRNRHKIDIEVTIITFKKIFNSRPWKMKRVYPTPLRSR